jgi:hypothetical protein
LSLFRNKLKSTQSFICMHPGHCKTDIGGKNAPKTPEQGAKAIYDTIML